MNRDMENAEQQFEQIEAYLSGALDGDERAVFEARMAADPEFAAEVELHREVAGAVADHGEVAFEENLRGIAEELEGAGEGKRRPWRNYLLAAAAVALLAVVGWVVFQGGDPPTPQDLFAEHFQAYEAPATFRGKVPPEKLERAFAPYKGGEWAVALGEFEQLEGEYPGDEEVLFYAGISELALGNGAEGRAYLQRVLALPAHTSEVQGKWYIALSWLAEGNAGAARPLLEELAGFDNRFQPGSAAILEELGE